MFTAPKKTEESKSFGFSLEEQRRFEELNATKERYDKEKHELEEQLKKIEAQSGALWRPFYDFRHKPDAELEKLLKTRMQKLAEGVRCEVDYARQAMEIRISPVEDLEAIRNVFGPFVDPSAMQISAKPLDGTRVMGAPPTVYVEIKLNQRESLLTGLQLSEAEFNIPLSTKPRMKC